MHHILPVRIDSAWFGFDALDVEEILTVPSCVPLPNTRQGVVGVLRWREQALAVIDIASGTSALAPGTMRSRVVVVRAAGAASGSDAIAVPVSSVREVRERRHEEAEDPPTVDVPALLRAIAGPESPGEHALEEQPARADDAPANLVAISCAGVDYALATDVVRAIVSPRDWTGPDPFDFAELARAPRGHTTAQERLVVVSAAGRELALRVAGAVSFRQLEASQLLPLPPLLRGRAPRDLVDRIAFFDQRPPLLLLNPAAFA
jgi:chemotaxis signal transduction protein